MTSHPKILIVSFTSRGLLNPSLSFAERLTKMGADVTFSTSFSVIRGMDKETTPHGVSLAPFSDGHDNGKQPTTSLEQIMTDFATNGASGVAEILGSAAAQGHPFDHLVYTTALPWAAAVASSNGVKSTLLWCQPAIILAIYYHYYNGYESLFSNDSNPTTLINLPGLLPLTVTDLPSFFSPTRSKEFDFLLGILKSHIDELKTVPRILVNTLDELEIEPIRALDKVKFFPVGPLIQPKLLDSKDTNEWLNSKPKSSVVYVSFGSLATLSMDQVEEISLGLLKSGRAFVWVIRDSDQAERLTKKDELKKQGMIVNWCSQVAVLNHQSIGCFVTHCGWNSTLEALAAGVPVVAFPMFSDQGTNAKMIEDVWKTGVRVKNRRDGDGMVDGNEIERCVEMVMTGENSSEMRRNAGKWRDRVSKALNEGGSSMLNLKAFLDDV